jgi:hypothetical protein
MKKLINSLKYGDHDTKVYLWSILVLSSAAAIFAVSAVLLLSFFSGAISVFCAVIAALLSQSTTLSDKEFKKPEPKEEKEKEAEGSGEEKDKEKKDGEEETVSRVEHYSEKQVIQLMHKHKVKRDNRKVMIDLCPTFHIRQSPAYFWSEAGKANFLVLEEEARVIQIPLNKIRSITYEHGVSVHKKSDYTDFKAGGFVAQVFEELMPSYYMALKNGKKGYFKNLYCITPDLKVTNTSARALFDILKLDLTINDGITNSPRYSEYYKMAYRANVLWKDQVISTEEYQERIKDIFSAFRGGVKGKQYDELTEQMVESKFITREYAEYYKNL